jgi:hypothetical protein
MLATRLSWTVFEDILRSYFRHLKRSSSEDYNDKKAHKYEHIFLP